MRSILMFLAAAAVTGGLAWYGVFALLVADQRATADKLNETLVRLNEKNQQNNRFRAERNGLLTEIERIRQRYAEVSALLPSEQELGKVLEDFRAAAARNRVTLVTLDNRHAPYRKGLNESPHKIVLRGEFGDIRNVLKWVADCNRLIIVRSCDFDGKPTGAVTITLDANIPVDFPSEEDRKNPILNPNAVVSSQLPVVSKEKP